MSALRALFFSLIVHLAIFALILQLAPLFQTPKPQTIEVVFDKEAQILDALTPKKQQIVRQALTPEKIKAPDDETLSKYLSDQKQRVQQESRAEMTGKTANRSNHSIAQKISPAVNPAASATPPAPKLKDGYKPMDITNELREMSRSSEGPSTVGESLSRDVKIGSFTALNTDRYLFSTFYNRIEDLIRYRWEARVQGAISRFDNPTLRLLGGHSWVTNVEFLLDKNGLLKKALIMKESGVPYFDAAAVEAFREARLFPNPPAEMVQEDGYIHLSFSFTVNYKTPAFAQQH